MNSSNKDRIKITLPILEWVASKALLKQIKGNSLAENNEFLENKFLEKGGIAVYPTEPFKCGYKRFFLVKNHIAKKSIGIRSPLNDEQIKIISNFVGPEILNKSNTDMDYLRNLKALLVQRCNVQNPDTLTWEEILVHINIFLSKSNQEDHSANDFDTGDKEQTLRPSIVKAYQSYEIAIKQNPQLTGKKDKDVYDWLKEYGHEDYRLPAFETWQRYLRAGRNHYGTQKNTPRAGRTPKNATKPTDPDINHIFEFTKFALCIFEHF